jgi:hypothetical protein
MAIKVGEVAALFRYPVKSMSGERLDVADLGWHGLEGDRRLAFRRTDDRGGFPWLTAGKLPELILFAPQRRGPAGGEGLPTHIRTPEGGELEVFGVDLAAEVGRRHRSPVQMMHLKHGIFDDASISVITSATVEEIGRLATQPPDVRRFRPNILIASPRFEAKHGKHAAGFQDFGRPLERWHKRHMVESREYGDEVVRVLTRVRQKVALVNSHTRQSGGEITPGKNMNPRSTGSIANQEAGGGLDG